jgi:hypothetical protein
LITATTVACFRGAHGDLERDDAHTLLVLTVRGDVTFAQVLSVLDRLVAEGLWTYRLLYDGRLRTKSLLSEADVRNLAMHLAILTEKLGARGRVAIVSLEARSALTEKYRILVQQHVNLEIDMFRDIASAMTWLDNVTGVPSPELDKYHG